jgi:hypothetical protein
MKKSMWFMLMMSGMAFATEFDETKASGEKIAGLFKEQLSKSLENLNKASKEVLEKSKKTITEKEKPKIEEKIENIENGEIDKEIIASPEIIFKNDEKQKSNK